MIRFKHEADDHFHTLITAYNDHLQFVFDHHGDFVTVTFYDVDLAEDELDAAYIKYDGDFYSFRSVYNDAIGQIEDIIDEYRKDLQNESATIISLCDQERFIDR